MFVGIVTATLLSIVSMSSNAADKTSTLTTTFKVEKGQLVITSSASNLVLSGERLTFADVHGGEKVVMTAIGDRIRIESNDVTLECNQMTFEFKQMRVRANSR